MPEIDEFSAALGELREFARATRDQLVDMKRQQERHHQENKDSMGRLATSTSKAIGEVTTELEGVKTEVSKIKTERKVRKAFLIGGATVAGLIGGATGGPVSKAIAALLGAIGKP